MVEIKVIGTPAEIEPHLTRIAEGLNFRGFNYRVWQIRSESGQHSMKFEVLCGKYFEPNIRWLDDQMDEATRRSTHCVGRIALHPLPNSRTLITINKQESTNWKDAEVYFSGFLHKFNAELKRLGFKEAWYKRAWHVIKELIGIARLAKP